MFGDTLSAALRFTVRHKLVLLRITIIPILLAILLQLVAMELQSELFNWTVMFIEALLSSIIAINVHRIVLKGEDSVPHWGRFTIGKIELWFFAHYLSLWFGVYAIFLLTPLIGFVAGVLAIVAGIISCRLCIVFPAIALGKGVSFPYAWQLTAQKTLYMLCVVAIAPFIFGLFLVPIALLSPLPALFTFFSYVVTILAVITLSFAYQNLTEAPEPVAPDAEK
ncbi:hypothetical protein LRP50_11605 [Enterovibrio sp. ZSDZ42]|uniref:DUF624 domain-containing protein n=1 Tax=Enterovibrio gelatinilyticus TaxID=2899819 RepID=A0ABT5R0H0_9GAMM|nr:hypothetical protein [Enterovibrio sp. ZSDZ42]MDD1793777.1 hypothetical protein [Enterovibrio sp. ZSDZ42]